MSELIIKFINPVETEHYGNATRSTYAPNKGASKTNILENPSTKDYIKNFFELNGDAFDQAVINLSKKP
jgi:hypothetical protein